MKKIACDSERWEESIFDSGVAFPDALIKEFLGKESIPRSNGKVATSLLIRGFVSALKWWYTTFIPPQLSFHLIWMLGFLVSTKAIRGKSPN
jgi:hypothetical protein